MQANSIMQGGKLTQLVDPYLPTEGHTDEVEKMTFAASLCIRQAPQNRPQMDVVSFLCFLDAHLQLLMRFIFLVCRILQASGCNHQVLKLLEGDRKVLKWARSEAGLSCESDGDECVTQTYNPTSISHLMLKMMLPQSAVTISSQRTHPLKSIYGEDGAGHLASIDGSMAELPL
jgi:hypothetical protein